MRGSRGGGILSQTPRGCGNSVSDIQRDPGIYDKEKHPGMMLGEIPPVVHTVADPDDRLSKLPLLSSSHRQWWRGQAKKSVQVFVLHHIPSSLCQFTLLLLLLLFYRFVCVECDSKFPEHTVGLMNGNEKCTRNGLYGIRSAMKWCGKVLYSHNEFSLWLTMNISGRSLMASETEKSVFLTEQDSQLQKSFIR